MFYSGSSHIASSSVISIAAVIQDVSTHLLSMWAPTVSGAQRNVILNQYLGISHAEVPPIVGAGMSVGPEGTEQLELLSNIDSEALDLKKFRETTKLTTDVHLTRTGEIVASVRPAMGGDSIGHQNGDTGTIGCLVRNRKGQNCLLSCNHVLAALNRGQRNKDAIWNPGSHNRGGPQDRIGVLHDFTELDFSLGKPNFYDAALCRLDSPGYAASGIRSLGTLAAPVTNPAFGLPVRKEGQQTKVTDGIVRLKNLSHQVVFADGQRARFDNQLGIIGTGESDFAAPGDSGALVVDEQKRPVGLLFAVASGIDLAFASPIGAVLLGLEIELA